MRRRGSWWGRHGAGLIWLLGTAASGQVTPIGPEVPVATTATFQGAPTIAADLLGNFVVVWQKQSATTGGWDIFARQYGKGGVPFGPEFQVNSTGGSGCRQFPVVAADALGNFIVACKATKNLAAAPASSVSSGTAPERAWVRNST